jgi:hypothetical protein
MRLPGRASLAAFVVMVTTTTFFCSDGAHHDIQIAASPDFRLDIACPTACTSVITVEYGRL